MSAGAAWESLLARSISAFYGGNLAEGRLACDQLLCLPDLPAHVREVTRTNQVHYARPLRELAGSYQESALSPSPMPGAARRAVMIAAAAEGWLVLIESTLGGGDHQITWAIDRGSAAGHRVQTIVRLDRSLQPIGDPSPAEEVTGGPDQAAWRTLRLMQDGADGIDGDAWMPAIIDHERFFVSCRGPTAALRREAQSGALTLVAFHDAPLLTQHLHGAAPLVETGDGLLALVFDVVTWESGEQSTVHRFVRFDRAFRMTDLSHPFLLRGTGVELVSGLAGDGRALAFTFRIGDDACHVASLDLREALALLRPVALLAPHGLHPFAMPEGVLKALARGEPRDASPPRVPDPETVPVLRAETVIDALRGSRRSSGGPRVGPEFGDPLEDEATGRRQTGHVG